MNSVDQQLSKREIWQELLNRWRQSNLTAKQFCQQHQLKEADLRRWSYRLNKENPNQDLNPHSTQSISNQFIPITVSESATASKNHSPIDIVLGKNYSLRLTKHFDEEMLINLIKALRRAELC
jgi:hypothetical protein